MPELPEDSQTPETAPETPAPQKRRRPSETPAPTPAEKLIEEATLPDSSFDPELDGLPPAKEAAATNLAASETAGTPAAEPPKHSPRSVRLARQLNIANPDDFTPEELDEEIYSRNFEVLAALRAQAASPASPPPAAPPEPDEFDLGMTPEEEGEWDPRHLKVLKKFAEAGKKVKALEAALQQQQQTQRTKEAQARLDMYDEAFAEHEELFGKGGFTEIDPKSEEYDRRDSVAMKVGTDPTPKKIRAAIKRLYPQAKAAKEPAKEVVDEKLEENKRRFKNGTVTRPTHRGVRDLPKGPERALKMLNGEFKDRGWTDESFEGVEEQNLPE